jgi:hypothetical protein
VLGENEEKWEENGLYTWELFTGMDTGCPTVGTRNRPAIGFRAIDQHLSKGIIQGIDKHRLIVYFVGLC